MSTPKIGESEIYNLWDCFWWLLLVLLLLVCVRHNVDTPTYIDCEVWVNSTNKVRLCVKWQVRYMAGELWWWHVQSKVSLYIQSSWWGVWAPKPLPPLATPLWGVIQLKHLVVYCSQGTLSSILSDDNRVRLVNVCEFWTPPPIKYQR